MGWAVLAAPPLLRLAPGALALWIDVPIAAVTLAPVRSPAGANGSIAGFEKAHQLFVLCRHGSIHCCRWSRLS